MIADLRQAVVVHTVKGFQEVDGIDVQRDVIHDVLLNDVPQSEDLIYASLGFFSEVSWHT